MPLARAPREGHNAAMAEDPRPYQPPASGVNRAVFAVAALLVLLAAAGGWWWWQQRAAPPPAVIAPPVAAAPAEPAPPTPAEPVIQHPIDAPAEAAARTLPALDQSDPALKQALTELLGSKAVAQFLLTDGFVRRVVATVDNLGRVHAAPRLWPVVPTGGRFSVQSAGERELVAPGNAARYNAFVALATAADPARAAAVYRAHYPLFQAAYRELGYPNGYFNDRLVEVIDQLLATPEPTGPLAVRLTEVKGPIEADRPWVRYEFADPALQALPAGSKMLLRMGNDHARQLKAQLRPFRDAVARTPVKN
jgi:hypothetical protein